MNLSRRTSRITRLLSVKPEVDEEDEYIQEQDGQDCTAGVSATPGDNANDIESHPSNANGHHLRGRQSELTPHQILYLAALENNWERARPILKKDPSLATEKITERGERVLHIAASARSTQFVRELVKLMKEGDLELKSKDGSTAFCFAAVSGVVEIAEAMRDKNKELPNISNKYLTTPITFAASLGNKDMVSYLYKVTNLEKLQNRELFELLEVTIQNEIYGSKSVGVLQDKSSQRKQAGVLLKELWAEWELFLEDELSELVADTEILHSAAKAGNVEFLAVLIRNHPDLIWTHNQKNQTIFHVAVLHREEKVFSLIHQIGAIKNLITLKKDDDYNNILHLAGMLGQPNDLKQELEKPQLEEEPTEELIREIKQIRATVCIKVNKLESDKIIPPSLLKVSGAALRMQREIMWFKEVEKTVPSSLLKSENKDGKTPGQLFTEEHKLLLKEGERWMKDTSNSCMIVATLIATVMFAAAFTVPGGNNSDEGTPILLKQNAFAVFVISDAVALFSSIVSIIMFLSILTSRYTEVDFLVSLPAKLLFGLTTLFVAIVSMLVAFAATFFLVYNYHRAYEPKLIAAFAGVPVALFAILQYRLWLDTAKSTYLSRFLFRPGKHRIYNKQIRHNRGASYIFGRSKR
ncbi:hypothetical protein RND71_033849 [Anisodus tanguticus]|uniref:PGG domain-containing protein n=1 Tax=Anisodus tanguticus TaxID=243964 RepID=A0AAE1R8J0_9SOLA|nr:hypothetical protein RND71_033849 [Anisodus tanguticus]